MWYVVKIVYNSQNSQNSYHWNFQNADKIIEQNTALKLPEGVQNGLLTVKDSVVFLIKLNKSFPHDLAI